jgi:hypothetical protein
VGLPVRGRRPVLHLGKFVYKRWDWRRTVYALTNQRALILRGGSLQSVFLNQLPTIHHSVRTDGSGSLEFGSFAGWYGRGHWANTGMDLFSPGSGVPAFYDVPDVAKVDRLVNQARSGSG